MKKILTVLFVLISLSFGAKEKIGQKYYMKACSKCHGDGSRGGNLASINGWSNYFKDNANELIKMHKGEEGCENILKYLISPQFKKEESKMLRFLQEFANDSDTIPSCNN